MPKLLYLIPFDKFSTNGTWAMLRWLWLSVIVIIIDQVSKIIVDASMTLYESVVVMPYLNLTYVRNTGAAFSFLSEAGGWQRWFFAGLAIAISTVLTVWLARTKKHQTLLAIALAFILGGALGNLIDRVAYGYVIDFIAVYYGSWHFSVFNLADSAITLGVGLLLLDSFITKEEDDHNDVS